MNVYRRKVDGPQRQQQFPVVRENIPLDGDFHGRFHLVALDFYRDRLRKSFSAAASYAGCNIQLHDVITETFEIKSDNIVAD